MANRSMIKLFDNGCAHVLTHMKTLGPNVCQRQPLSDWSTNKSVKHIESKTNLWTNKEHEEWVDRKFGPLAKQIARSDPKAVNGKNGNKKITQ